MKFENPWGPNKEENKGKKNDGNNVHNDFEEISKKVEAIFGNFFSKNNQNKNNKNNIPLKPLIGMVPLALILIWLSFGLYKVNPDEKAVVLYFGKFYSVSDPGLNYHIPYPFGKILKKSVTSVNTEEFGFSSNRFSNERNFEAESLMLTGDENIVDIEFQIQWQIGDIKHFIFNISDPEVVIKKVAESSMREVIAKTPIANALSDGKYTIEQESKKLMQAILDEYKAGIRIVLVQLRRVDPPSQVIDAFRDVQTARADKEREINQAQAYKNDIIPRARGNAVKLIEEAKAYKEETIANAEGESKRFLSVYNQYKKSKLITRKRIYIETMEDVYKDINKIIIDQDISKSGIIPYLPINDLKKYN